VLGAVGWGGALVAFVGSVVVSVVTSVTGAWAGFGGVGVGRTTGVLVGGGVTVTGGTILATLTATRGWARCRTVVRRTANRRVELTGWTLSCTTTGSLACET
jgi:hypothetical protein